MGTIEKIKLDGECIIEKVKRGEVLTSDDNKVLKIYNSLYSKKAGNAGKRKNEYAPKKAKNR